MYDASSGTSDHYLRGNRKLLAFCYATKWRVFCGGLLFRWARLLDDKCIKLDTERANLYKYVNCNL